MIMRNILIIGFLSFTILFSANVASAQVKTGSDSILVINAVVNKENKVESQDYLSQMVQIFKDNLGKPVARYKQLGS